MYFGGQHFEKEDLAQNIQKIALKFKILYIHMHRHIFTFLAKIGRVLST